MEQSTIKQQNLTSQRHVQKLDITFGLPLNDDYETEHVSYWLDRLTGSAPILWQALLL